MCSKTIRCGKMCERSWYNDWVFLRQVGGVSYYNNLVSWSEWEELLW